MVWTIPLAALAWTPALQARELVDADATVAADADGSSSQDIVVTAQRRESNLLETPISISAVASEDLAAAHVETLVDLAGKLPGVNLPNNYPTMQAIYIRGIGTNDPGVASAVGIYVDDVYIPRTFGNGLFDLPDVERIEVLRGPQGALYGQNTSAGAVKIVSKRPSNSFTGSVYGEYGNYDAFRGQVYLSGPLVKDVLAASIAYSHRQRDGYTYNANTKRWVDAVDTDQARFKLLLTPSDTFEAQLSVDRTWENSDNPVGIPLNFGTADPRVTYANTDTRLNRDSGGAALNLKLDVSDAVSLRSISAYRTVHDHPSPWDWDGTPTDRFGWVQSLESKQYSQEVQVLGDGDRFDWTIGAIYLHETFDFDRLTWRGLGYSEIESHLTLDGYGIYGQASYALTDRLTVTLGGRYGGEKQTSANASYANKVDGTRTALIYSVSDLHSKSDSFTPKLGVDYRLSDSGLLYASVTRGAKSGGFNRAAGTAKIASIPVGLETVTAYELGVKGRAGNVLQGSVAAFYNDFKGYQASVSNPTVNGELVAGQVIVNAGKAETYGIEAEATLRPVEGLNWQLSASWLKAKFLQFSNPTGAVASNFTGNRLPFAPEWTLGGRIEYRLPLDVPGDVTATFSGNYRSETFVDVANTKATRIGANTFFDLGLSYRTQDKHWTFQVLAKNLFDRTSVIGPHFLVASLATDVVGYSPPRLVTGSIRYAF